MKKYGLVFLSILILVIGIYFFTLHIKTVGEAEPPQKTPPQMITADEAAQIVSNLPEVKQWELLFSGPGSTSPETGGTPVITEDSETNTAYIIHVYEDTPDHTATFGWYDVDKTTGAVTEENQ